jgi:hypothetical protein
MKKVLLTIGLCLFLFAGLMTGCEGLSANSEEVNNIVSNILETNAAVDSYRVDISILQEFHLEKTEDYADMPDAMTLTSNGSGMLDVANGEMQMQLTTNIAMAGESTQGGTVETFIVDGYIYSKYPTPEGDTEWVKMAMPKGMWDKQNQLVQQAEILKTADSVEYLGDESIDGMECYVVEIYPSDQTIEKLLSQIDMPVTSSQLKTELSNIFKDLVIKEWISKDSYLISKTQQHAVIELEPKDIGLENNEFKKMVVSLDIEMKLYDYNMPLSIELPAGALDATEIME